MKELAKVITWFPSAPVSPVPKPGLESCCWERGSARPQLCTLVAGMWCWASRRGLRYGAPVCSPVSSDLGGVLAGEVLGSREQHPSAVWLCQHHTGYLRVLWEEKRAWFVPPRHTA